VAEKGRKYPYDGTPLSARNSRSALARNFLQSGRPRVAALTTGSKYQDFLRSPKGLAASREVSSRPRPEGLLTERIPKALCEATTPAVDVGTARVHKDLYAGHFRRTLRSQEECLTWFDLLLLHF
jgi:hypothetical protein